MKLFTYPSDSLCWGILSCIPSSCFQCFDPYIVGCAFAWKRLNLLIVGANWRSGVPGNESGLEQDVGRRKKSRVGLWSLRAPQRKMERSSLWGKENGRAGFFIFYFIFALCSPSGTNFNKSVQLPPNLFTFKFGFPIEFRSIWNSQNWGRICSKCLQVRS